MLRSVLFLVVLTVSCRDSKDPTETADTILEDTAPVITWAEVEIINETGWSIFHVYQCHPNGTDCIDEVHGTLVNQESLVYRVDPGLWETWVVDELNKCTYTGPYQLYAGDHYSWRVRELSGLWNGETCNL